jgi:hypothetical protein
MAPIILEATPPATVRQGLYRAGWLLEYSNGWKIDKPWLRAGPPATTLTCQYTGSLNKKSATLTGVIF